MALVQRYSDTFRGEMIFVGNTLQFSSVGGIEAFLSTNPALSVPGFPVPATLNWKENGSTAVLNIPAGSTIEYAELIWGGSRTDNTQTLPISTINTPITFITPNGSNTIIFDPATAVESTGQGQNFYTRSQNVTRLVQAAGSGTYEVNGVPAILSQSLSATASAGWLLAITYSNESALYRNMKLYIGNEAIDPMFFPLNTNLTGFLNPATGPLSARVLVSAMEGDFSITGDFLQIGPNTAALVSLSGPNNLVSNFFTSIINDDTGNYDNSEYFGNLNQTLGISTSKSGSILDITNVYGSSNFVNSQNSALVRFGTTLDTYAVSILGVSIAVNEANTILIKSADSDFVQTGNIITYTFTIQNIIDADNAVFMYPLQSGTSYIPGSLSASQPFTGIDPTIGITFTDQIVAGESITITFQAKIDDTVPYLSLVANEGILNYNFISGFGLSPFNNTEKTSNSVSTQANVADLISPGNFQKATDKVFANIGDEISYTITFTNTGNLSAENVVITDSIPSETSLVPGSLIVNVPFTGSLATEISLTNSVTPGETILLSYKLLVDAIPSLNPIPNTATLKYEYTVDPAEPPITESIDSNTVASQVNPVNIFLGKAANKNFVDVGEEIQYTIAFNNVGSVDLQNIILTDPIPNGTSLVSLTINKPFTGDLDSGIRFTNPLTPDEISTLIIYSVLVEEIPSPNPIPNMATLDYQYILDPSQPPVSGTQTSRMVNVQVNNATLTPLKIADKSVADIGDEILHTITFTNTGNVNAENVVITDTIPNGTSLVPGSLSVSVPFTGTLDGGINLTNPVAESETILISYSLLVNTIPNPNPIPNVANVTYEYIVNPANPAVTKEVDSNTVTTQVNNGDFSTPSKISDKRFAEVGDTILHTIVFGNLGNVNAENVVITDPIPNGTRLVPGSLIINADFTGTLDGGINLTNPVIPDENIVINYALLIEEIPNPNPIPNTAILNYEYRLDSTQPPIIKSKNSNTTTTKVNSVILIPEKTSDKVLADVGDEILYTITFTNIGNDNAQNVVITDPIPNGTSLVPGSLNVNVPFTGTLDSGINLTNPVTPNENITIIYKVLVDQVPNPNPIPNTATLDYQYILDPTDPPIMRTIDSNEVIIQVNNGDISTPVKIGDKDFADIGEEIVHTITFTNTGNVSSDNVTITDPIPNGTSLVPNSLTLNVPFTGTLEGGLNLTNPIEPGETIVISYTLLVESLPNPNPIENTAIVDYEYTVNPEEPPEIKTVDSNTVTTEVNNATLIPVKNGDRDFADVGEEILHTITFTNTGNANAENVVITDPIPNGTSLVPGSLNVNVPFAGTLDSGINLTNPVAPNEAILITYRLLVDEIPNPNPIPNTATINYRYTLDPAEPPIIKNIDSNTITTLVNNANIEAPVKIGTPSDIVEVGDKIDYSITFTNTGNVNVEEVVIRDPIRNGTSLVEDSLSVNVNFTGDLDSGIVLTDPVAPGKTIVINYTLLVEQIPNPNPIENTATVDYKYRVDTDEALVMKSVDSNTITILVNPVLITKTCTPEKASLTETITYNFIITNTSAVDITNVMFFDILPSGVTFVEGSFIGSTNPNVKARDLVTGVPLGTLTSGQTITPSFKVTVSSVPCPQEFPNTASITYFAEFEEGVVTSGTSTSEKCTVDYLPTSFLQCFTDGMLKIPPQKPEMERILSVDVNLLFQDHEVIDTPVGISYSKQNLTGKKLLAYFKLCIVITYVANHKEQSVHTAEYELPKCEYIVIPNIADYNCLINLSYKIEDIFYNQLDKRMFFYNVTYVIESGI